MITETSRRKCLRAFDDFWVWTLMLVCGLDDLLEDDTDEGSDVGSEGLSIGSDIVFELSFLNKFGIG
jgi:hypothetical protein